VLNFKNAFLFNPLFLFIEAYHFVLYLRFFLKTATRKNVSAIFNNFVNNFIGSSNTFYKKTNKNYSFHSLFSADKLTLFSI